jgi:hypothetical protein
MNKTLKVVLIVVGVLLILCICGVVIFIGISTVAAGSIISLVGQNTSTDPAKVSTAAAEIADFTPPPGFEGRSANMMGFTTMFYINTGTLQNIILIQFPSSAQITPEQMMVNVRSQISGSNGSNIQYTVTEEKPITIRGQQTTLTVAEGTSSQGVSFLQLIAPFQGKGGTAMVAITGPTDSFDEAYFISFLESMR